MRLRGNVLSFQRLRTTMKGLVLREEGEFWRCPTFQADVLRAVQQAILDWERQPDWYTLLFANRMTWEMARILNSPQYPQSHNPKAYGLQACPHCSDMPGIQLISACSLSLRCTPKMYPPRICYTHTLCALGKLISIKMANETILIQLLSQQMDIRVLTLSECLHMLSI